MNLDANSNIGEQGSTKEDKRQCTFFSCSDNKCGLLQLSVLYGNVQLAGGALSINKLQKINLRRTLREKYSVRTVHGV